MSASVLDHDPLVQIRLSDLLALRAAAASATLPPVPSTPADAPVQGPPALPEYMDTKEAARLLGVTVKGLEAMRARGEGPPFIRVGRRVRYAAADLRRGI
jgi:hypothetical protein